jgi:UDP-N-acetylmuramoylalanine--D-glutamate ligase
MDGSAIRGKRFSVIGGARSGMAVATLLNAHGATVFLSEKAPAETMQPAIAELERLRIAYEFGTNSPRVLESEIIVLSPGVPSDIPLVMEGLAKGVKVVSEMEVASWFCPAPMVAITGTNGKTTTTALTGRMFEDAKKPSVVAGNIGLAFSQVVETLTDQSTAVLEVSSFQLDYIETFRPRVSVILNITPDHLDRYEHSFEKYIAAKCRVFENQREGDTIIYNWDDEVTRGNVERRLHPGVKRLPFSIRRRPDEGGFVREGYLTVHVGDAEFRIIATSDISIRGYHNLYNAMAATLVGKVMGVPAASLKATLKNFKGVEHRLEFVREVRGVTYVNDSKATNVDSVWYALQSFDKPVVLLLGGRDKGNDYSRLQDLVRNTVKTIVAIGESADKVVGAFSALVPVTMAKTMDEAVHVASAAASPGMIVLLSPACASFDWFENYEHRGRVFKQLVAALEG